MNRSLLKDNSNMKENEYDNGYIERQTVSSNPPELPQIRVSVFENYFAQKPLGDVDLIKWCKTAKFKEQVIAFRTTSNEKVRQRIKRNLPCITPSGIFKTRSRDGLVQHSGYLCIDIDHKDNGVFGPEWFEKKKLLAKAFDCLFYAGMSIQREWSVPDFPHRLPEQAPGAVRRAGSGGLRENGARSRPRVLRHLPLAGSQLRCLPIHQSARQALSGRAHGKNGQNQSPDGPGKGAAR